MSSFEIKVGIIARLISCDNCRDDYGDCNSNDPCSHRALSRKLIRVIEQYKHEDPGMETPCYVVSSLDGETHIEGIRMWDLEELSPLERLAGSAE